MTGTGFAVVFALGALVLLLFGVKAAIKYPGSDMVDEWEGMKNMGITICPTSDGPENWPEDDEDVRVGIIRCGYCGSGYYAEDKKTKCSSCGAPLEFGKPKKWRDRSIPKPDPVFASEFRS